MNRAKKAIENKLNIIIDFFSKLENYDFGLEYSSNGSIFFYSYCFSY